jgi:hypothetical protein
MKNYTTLLFIIFFYCLTSGQSALVGTWETPEGDKLILNTDLTGTFHPKEETFSSYKNYSVIASETGDAAEPVPVSMSLVSSSFAGGLSTVAAGSMTGQLYFDTKENSPKLQVLYVNNNENVSTFVVKTLFFSKTSSNTTPAIPPITSSPLKENPIPIGLIGSYFNFQENNNFNITSLYQDTPDFGRIEATYRFSKNDGFIQMRGFFTHDIGELGIRYSLTGNVPLLDKDNKPFAITIVGAITKNDPNGDEFFVFSTVNIAHATGGNATYSAVRSEGGYYRKGQYSVLENTMIKKPFTDNGASNWVADMAIGDPECPLIMEMNLDTGGNYDWVNSVQCASDVCTAGHHQFNPDKSKTFKLIDKTPKAKDWSVWGTSMANLGTDQVNIDPSDPNNALTHNINLITKFDETAQFKELLWDGAFAIPSYSTGGNPLDSLSTIDNIMVDLVANNTIDPNKVNISFYYDKKNGKGKYKIGSDIVDPALVDIDSKIVLKQDSYGLVSYVWSTTLNGVTVGGTQITGINKNTRFAFDTGASIMKGDASLMNQVTDLFNAGEDQKIEYSMGTDKDGNPGKFVLLEDDYYKMIEQGDNYGTKQLQVNAYSSLKDLWLQGTTLLENVYTVFKYDVSYNTKGEPVLSAREVNMYNKIGGPLIIQK